MKRLINYPSKVEIDFTNEQLTGTAGHLFLAHAAKQFGLPKLLKQLKVKQRRRGSSDSDMLMSLISSLAAGQGHLSDLDYLRNDETATTLLGIENIPDSRRLGEYIRRYQEEHIVELHHIERQLVKQVAPKVIEHSAATKGYVPVFIDGTGIEVEGHYFEEARKGYNGELQYWLHSIFVDGLWVSERFHPGGTGVTHGWKEQLEKDVVPLLSDSETDIWVRMDSAYYSKDVIDYCHEQGWDYSVSVTDPNKKRPILEKVTCKPDSEWQSIGFDEKACIAVHQPHHWLLPQTYVVIKSESVNGQGELFPIYTVILVSREDLPLKELVKRHRGKQGQENAFKGPLIDLDLHHPPCQSFKANQVIYACGLMAQVLLRALQFNYLPVTARKHGIRPIIRYFIRTVARLVYSARQWRLLFTRNSYQRDWINYAAGILK